jgi:hypothetical protein
MKDLVALCLAGSRRNLKNSAPIKPLLARLPITAEKQKK